MCLKTRKGIGVIHTAVLERRDSQEYGYLSKANEEMEILHIIHNTTLIGNPNIASNNNDQTSRSPS